MRELVLRIGDEGGDFSVYADLDAGPERFEYRASSSFVGDTLTGTVAAWSELLERQLRPHRWLRLSPLMIHPSFADRVLAELRRAPDGEVGDRWWRLAALRPALSEPETCPVDLAADFFGCSDTARVHREAGTTIANRPKEPATWHALANLERWLLEPIARQFGAVTVTYGFAGPDLVRAVRRRATAEDRLPNINPRTDQHAGHERGANGKPICARGGVAVDLKVVGTPSMEVTDWVAHNHDLRFDRIYRYPPMPGSADPLDRPFHLSWSPEPHRQMVDMVPKQGGGLRPRVVR